MNPVRDKPPRDGCRTPKQYMKQNQPLKESLILGQRQFMLVSYL